jgi:Zn-finger nucleic acid-binding protein
MKCPTCTDVTLSMTERNGIEIDYCSSCRGVWLDRGELDKIIEKSLAEKSEPSQQPRERVQEVIYHDSDHHKKDAYGYKQKRKKSFLEELFD